MDGELENREAERLSPEQQTEVLRLAARMQAMDADRLTPEQLARIAAEAGIEERFVHKAIERLSVESASKELRPIHARDPALSGFMVRKWEALFGASQIWAMFVLISRQLYFKQLPLVAAATLGLAFIMGFAGPSGTRETKRGLVWIVGSAAAGLLAAGLLAFATNLQTTYQFENRVAFGVAAQAVTFLLGRLLGSKAKERPVTQDVAQLPGTRG